MAHNKNPDKLCQDACVGLMEVCTMLQLENNPDMAQLAASLGANVKAGLIGTEGKGEARGMPKAGAKPDAPETKIG